MGLVTIYECQDQAELYFPVDRIKSHSEEAGENNIDNYYMTIRLFTNFIRQEMSYILRWTL
ncbi:hypothetical protein NSMM_80023 [Nitrosomonas mobilis]|uniref:Uncharacterized protein n=1 Tax=Nitrosomonas mobilis TaxID=51642 RepID=A0A1G5SHW1_9PROT|nr:hypothetical protein NSMM_80023 [Nitrosomonas mobilis]